VDFSVSIVHIGVAYVQLCTAVSAVAYESTDRAERDIITGEQNIIHMTANNATVRADVEERGTGVAAKLTEGCEIILGHCDVIQECKQSVLGVIKARDERSMQIID